MMTSENQHHPKRHCMIVHAYYPLGETRVERQAQALIQNGYQVDVVCLLHSSDKLNEEVVDGVNVYRLPVRRNKQRGALGQLFEYLSFFFMALFKAAFLHQKRRYRTVQVHNLPDFLVFAAIWPKLTGARVLLDIHDIMPEFYAMRFKLGMSSLLVRLVLLEERLSCWFADNVIITTHRWRDTLISRGVRAEKISIVLNLADERLFKQGESPRRHPGQADFKIIYHGTITQRYGVDSAIKAVNLLKERIPGIQLVLVGGGEYRNDAEKLVSQLGIQEKVVFIDTVVSSILPELLAKADIGVTAYRVDGFTEGCLPTKLLEYTALGIPTVAAKTPVIADYFTDDLIEYCQPGSVDDLAEHIYYLYTHPDRFNEIAANTDKFNQKYNWKKQAAEYVRLIDALQNKSYK